MLARTGVAVDVIEREPAWRHAGTGICLPGNAARALRAHGLEAQVASGRVSRGHASAVDCMRASLRANRTRLLRTRSRRPPACDRAPPRSCIRGEAAATPSLPRSISLSAPDGPRRTTMGAAEFGPATSRVSDEMTPGRSAHLPYVAGHRRDDGRIAEPRPFCGRTATPTKCLLIRPFQDGRGWFRTSGLSRVKRGPRTRVSRVSPCKSLCAPQPRSGRNVAKLGSFRPDLGDRPPMVCRAVSCPGRTAGNRGRA
jgi:hypothetical protein